MQVEELRELNALLEKTSKTGDIDDLDEVGYNLPKEEREKLRALVEKATEDDFIKTWIQNGRGISFTCWTWSHETYKIANKHNIELVDPEGD